MTAEEIKPVVEDKNTLSHFIETHRPGDVRVSFDEIMASADEMGLSVYSPGSVLPVELQEKMAWEKIDVSGKTLVVAWGDESVDTYQSRKLFGHPIPKKHFEAMVLDEETQLVFEYATSVVSKTGKSVEFAPRLQPKQQEKIVFHDSYSSYEESDTAYWKANWAIQRQFGIGNRRKILPEQAVRMGVPGYITASSEQGDKVNIEAPMGFQHEVVAMLADEIRRFPESVQHAVLQMVAEGSFEKLSKKKLETKVQKQIEVLMQMGLTSGLTVNEAQPPGLANGMLKSWLANMQELGLITIHIDENE